MKTRDPYDVLLELLDVERRRLADVLHIHRPTAVRDLEGLMSPQVDRCMSCYLPYPCRTAVAAGAEA